MALKLKARKCRGVRRRREVPSDIKVTSLASNFNMMGLVTLHEYYDRILDYDINSRRY